MIQPTPPKKYMLQILVLPISFYFWSIPSGTQYSVLRNHFWSFLGIICDIRNKLVTSKESALTTVLSFWALAILLWDEKDNMHLNTCHLFTDLANQTTHDRIKCVTRAPFSLSDIIIYNNKNHNWGLEKKFRKTVHLLCTLLTRVWSLNILYGSSIIASSDCWVKN